MHLTELFLNEAAGHKGSCMHKKLFLIICEKGALSSFGGKIHDQNFNLHIINKAVTQSQKYQILPELNKQEKRSPEHCLKLERWQGPPHINKVKQYKTLLHLFIQFIQS